MIKLWLLQSTLLIPIRYNSVKINALEVEILALECEWQEIRKELAQSKTELEELIEQGEARIKAIEQAKKG